MDFRWNSWNEEHVANHSVRPEEAEEVVLRARSPFPLAQEEEKFLVWGPTEAGRLLQVIFVIDADETIFIIHARALTEKEKRRYRRRTR